MSNALEPSDLLPREPIQTLIDPIRRFLHIEAMSGVLLVAATLAALIAANSSMGESFLAFWQTPVGLGFGAVKLELSLLHWINDFRMAIFFYVIGLEVKRELVKGELRDMRRAALPLAAAVGGMIAPATVYLLPSTVPGAEAGASPATDIAFVGAPGGVGLAHPGQPEDHAAVAGHRRRHQRHPRDCRQLPAPADALLLGAVGIAVIFAFMKLGAQLGRLPDLVVGGWYVSCLRGSRHHRRGDPRISHAAPGLDQ
jgi:hypothetical protein